MRNDLIPVNSNFEFLMIKENHKLIKDPLLFKLPFYLHKQMYKNFNQDFAKSIDLASVLNQK